MMDFFVCLGCVFFLTVVALVIWIMLFLKSFGVSSNQSLFIAMCISLKFVHMSQKLCYLMRNIVFKSYKMSLTVALPICYWIRVIAEKSFIPFWGVLSNLFCKLVYLGCQLCIIVLSLVCYFCIFAVSLVGAIFIIVVCIVAALGCALLLIAGILCIFGWLVVTFGVVWQCFGGDLNTLLSLVPGGQMVNSGVVEPYFQWYSNHSQLICTYVQTNHPFKYVNTTLWGLLK